QTQRSKLLGKSGERNRCKSGQREYPVARELVWILGPNEVDQVLTALLFLLGQLGPCRLRVIASWLSYTAGRQHCVPARSNTLSARWCHGRRSRRSDAALE